SMLSMVGNILLSGTNTYTGGTSIGNATASGTVTVTNNAALGTGVVNFATSGNGRLEVNGTSLSVGGLAGDVSGVVENNAAANGTLTLNMGTANSSTFNGVLQNGTL